MINMMLVADIVADATLSEDLVAAALKIFLLVAIVIVCSFSTQSLLGLRQKASLQSSAVLLLFS
jgi:hypothetical protein